MATAKKAEIIVSGFSQVNHKELMQRLDIHYRANETAFIWGEPGIGKSQQVEAFARKKAKELDRIYLSWEHAPLSEKRDALKNAEKYFVFCDMRLAQLDPTDLAGLPQMDCDFGAVIWKPQMVFAVMSHPKAEGILFLDELPQAAPSVQSAAYSVILDRKARETSFPNILVIAAGNQRQHGGVHFALPPALCNRGSHYELKRPSVAEWCDWANTTGNVDPRVTGFISHWGPALFTEMEKVRTGNMSAYASPRSWAKLGNLIKHVKPEEVDLACGIASATVGDENVATFRDYLITFHRLDMHDIAKNPEKMKALKLEERVALSSLIGFNTKVAYESIKAPNTAQTDKEFLKFIDTVCTLLLAFPEKELQGRCIRFLRDIINRDDLLFCLGTNASGRTVCRSLRSVLTMSEKENYART